MQNLLLSKKSERNFVLPPPNFSCIQLRRLYSVKPKPKSRNGNADNTVGRPVCECVCVCVAKGVKCGERTEGVGLCGKKRNQVF